MINIRHILNNIPCEKVHILVFFGDKSTNTKMALHLALNHFVIKLVCKRVLKDIV